MKKVIKSCCHHGDRIVRDDNSSVALGPDWLGRAGVGRTEFSQSDPNNSAGVLGRGGGSIGTTFGVIDRRFRDIEGRLDALESGGNSDDPDMDQMTQDSNKRQRWIDAQLNGTRRDPRMVRAFQDMARRGKMPAVVKPRMTFRKGSH